MDPSLLSSLFYILSFIPFMVGNIIDNKQFGASLNRATDPKKYIGLRPNKENNYLNNPNLKKPQHIRRKYPVPYYHISRNVATLTHKYW